MGIAFGARLVLVGLSLALGAIVHAADAGGALDTGRTLYLEGRHAGGAPLQGARGGGLGVSAEAAACVNCHRRSGLGGAEGRSYFPAIDAASLFTAKAPGTGPSASGLGRPAYTEAGLARAIREGVDPAGRRLDYMMPRYRLGDDELKSLVAYLRQLSAQAAPGVAGGVVHFATVIAPEVPRERADAMVDVLQACFDAHNAGPQARRGRQLLAGGMSLREQRPWQLHVWRLQGEPDTWTRQLEAQAHSQPVFAMVGGIGAAEWRPVHEFCERGGVPCLFPQVEAPPPADSAFYPLYLSRSVLLEAAILGRELAPADHARQRVVQVVRAGDASAAAAAEALRRTLGEQAIAEATVTIGAGAPVDAGAFGAAPGDALVLWLRGADLQPLGRSDPSVARVFVSATLAGSDEVPLPPAWKQRAHMAYPYELPQNRFVRMAPLQTMLHASSPTAPQDRVRIDAAVACSTLVIGMNQLGDHLNREYLVERLETVMEQVTATGQYPALTLGIGQRFASKSGYLVGFDAAAAGRLVPVGERVAP